MIIKTASDLKFAVESANPSTEFFTRRTMSFFGDTMKNYGVTSATVKAHSGELVECWELFRRSPVKHGNQSSAYFSKEDFKRCHGIAIR